MSGNYSIYWGAVAKFHRSNVWTNEGMVLPKVNNKILVIPSLNEVNKY